MTIVRAIFDNGKGKRREYELNQLSDEDFEAVKVNRPWPGMPTYWRGTPGAIEVYPMAPSALIEVDGVVQNVEIVEPTAMGHSPAD